MNPKTLRTRAIYRDPCTRFVVQERNDGQITLGMEQTDDVDMPWERSSGAWFHCDADDARAVADAILEMLR